MYVAHLVLIFREVKRVLRDDATLWLNIGDTYAGSGRGGQPEKPSENWQPDYPEGIVSRGLKQKDLMGVPWRLAFALQADGWYLRSDITWYKPNCLPESVKDRPTKSHEYVFLLVKSQKYYFNNEAIRKPYTAPINRWGGPKLRAGGHSEWDKGTGQQTYRDRNMRPNPAGRNRRTSDWLMESLDILIEETQEYLRHLINVRDGGGMLQDEAGDPLALLVNTQPFKGAHFAAFNARLITPCILAGTSPKACPVCGAPWERVLEKTGHINKREPAHVPWNTPTKTDSTGWAPTTRATDKFRPTCSCPDSDGSGRCVVLDPFAGSGTTLLVAEFLGRDSIGIELSFDYCKMIEKRLKEADIGGLGKNRKIERQIEGAVAKQLSLF
jgi:DNA modification methylase